MSSVIIIGGGAAGMMAAIMAARNGHSVTLMEKNEKLGKKLFITGKGRCNFTNAGDEEDIRQIFVTVDITAPIYWWKEYDTYKVGTVANSTSTMHKIHSKPFEMSDFSVDHCTDAALDMMQKNIDVIDNSCCSLRRYSTECFINYLIKSCSI